MLRQAASRPLADHSQVASDRRSLRKRSGGQGLDAAQIGRPGDPGPVAHELRILQQVFPASPYKAPENASTSGATEACEHGEDALTALLWAIHVCRLSLRFALVPAWSFFSYMHPRCPRS